MQQLIMREKHLNLDQVHEHQFCKKKMMIRGIQNDLQEFHIIG